ncbi:serpin family protein [Candidatus Uabimicrobium amorphum]|nr:serpin family protein [Candidatus Uabimicrobium amorphum]
MLIFLAIVIPFIACNSNEENLFPAKEKAKVTPEKVKQQAQNNNILAWELYQQLVNKESGKNIFYSPYSISTALAMTYAGAKGNTAQEMQQTLHFVKDEPHKAFSGLIDLIQAQNNQYKLNVANALWGQKSYKFLPSFLDTTGKNYGAGLHTVDFVKETEQARKTINTWVAKNTADKIKDLLPPNAITSETRLVLTNTIYFKGDWSSAFDKEKTTQDVFHIDAKTTENVDMMTQKPKKFAYYEEEGLQAVKLPYKGDDVAMYIFLPQQLSLFDKQISTQKLQEIATKMRTTKVWIKMPKFKTRYKFDAKEVLQLMGMKDAFALAADFSGMNGNKELRITKVIHEAFVAIDEEGTEAAAATGVVMSRKSMPRPPKRFFVDRPFVFTIVHPKTGSTLFVGRVTNPNK